MNKREAQDSRNLDQKINIRTFFKNSGKKQPQTPDETGALDLVSLFVGLIVLTVISGLIATTVYIIIPWSRDNLAKWQLSEVANAEAAYAGLTISNGGNAAGSIFSAFSVTPKMEGVPSNSYGSLRQLIQAGVFPASYLGDGTEDYLSNTNMLCVVPMGSGSGFQAAIQSDTGKVYAIDQNVLKPQEVPNGDAVCNGTVLGPVQQDPNASSTTTPSPSPTSTAAAPSASPSPTVAATSSATATATPTASPTPTPTATASSTPTTTGSSTQSASPTTSAVASPSATDSTTTPPPYYTGSDPLTPLPNADPNAKTRKFEYCHNGHMISTSYAGLLNGHTGMNVDIIPPIPSYSYPGWNWTPDTSKIYYNNCKPLS